MINEIKHLFISLYGILGSDKIIQNDRTKIFSSHIQDGMGITLALEAGLNVIIAGDFFPASLRRATELKTSYQLHINDKNSDKEYLKFIEKHNIKNHEIAWIANDIHDMSFYKNAGLRICIPEAHEDIKKIAHYTTLLSGNKGALRDAVEYIIKKQNKWDSVINKYLC